MRRWRVVVAPTLDTSTGLYDSERLVCRILRAGRTVARSGPANDASALLRAARAELRASRRSQ